MAKTPTKLRPEVQAVLDELRSLTPDRVKAIQKAAGTAADGRVGPNTARSVYAHRQREASKAAQKQAALDRKIKEAQLETLKQQTKAKAGEAAARKAEADAKRTAAEAKKAELKNQADWQKGIQQAVGGTVSIASAVGGFAAGKLVFAKGVENRWVKSLEKNKVAIKTAATEARSLSNQYAKTGTNKAVLATKMTELARTAGKTLPSMRSPLGVGVAGGALLLGGYSAYRAQTDKELVPKMVAQASAGFELGVAVGTIATTIGQRATPPAAVPIKDLAAINSAGKIGAAHGARGTKAAKAAISWGMLVNNPVTRALSRFAGPVIAAGVAAAGTYQVARADTGAEKRRIAGETAVSVGDILSVGSVTRTMENAQRIAQAVSQPGFTARAVDNITGRNMARVTAKMSDANHFAMALANANRRRGEAGLRNMQVAEGRQKLTPLQLLKPTKGDGMTSAHTRRQNGQTVRVVAYRTPTR